MDKFEKFFTNLLCYVVLVILVIVPLNWYLTSQIRYDVIDESGEVIHSNCKVTILKDSGTLYVTDRMGEEFIYINNKWKLRKSVK
mgnify:CR=1 FL=1